MSQPSNPLLNELPNFYGVAFNCHSVLVLFAYTYALTFSLYQIHSNIIPHVYQQTNVLNAHLSANQNQLINETTININNELNQLGKNVLIISQQKLILIAQHM